MTIPKDVPRGMWLAPEPGFIHLDVVYVDWKGYTWLDRLRIRLARLLLRRVKTVTCPELYTKVYRTGAG